MSIKDYSIKEIEEDKELDKQAKRLKIELLKLQVIKQELEIEKLHKM